MEDEVEFAVNDPEAGLVAERGRKGMVGVGGGGLVIDVLHGVEALQPGLGALAALLLGHRLRLPPGLHCWLSVWCSFGEVPFGCVCVCVRHSWLLRKWEEMCLAVPLSIHLLFKCCNSFINHLHDLFRYRNFLLIFL